MFFKKIVTFLAIIQFGTAFAAEPLPGDRVVIPPTEHYSDSFRVVFYPESLMTRLESYRQLGETFSPSSKFHYFYKDQDGQLELVDSNSAVRAHSTLSIAVCTEGPEAGRWSVSGSFAMKLSLGKTPRKKPFGDLIYDFSQKKLGWIDILLLDEQGNSIMPAYQDPRTSIPFSRDVHEKWIEYSSPAVSGDFAVPYVCVSYAPGITKFYTDYLNDIMISSAYINIHQM